MSLVDIIVLAANITCLIAIICITKSSRSEQKNDETIDRIDAAEESISKQISSGKADYLRSAHETQLEMQKGLSEASEKQIQTLYRIAKEQAESAADNHNKISTTLSSNNKLLLETNIKGFNDVKQLLYDFSDQQTESAHNTDKTLIETLQKNMNEIRDLTEKKLDNIQNSVNDKLDKSLNERLDSSFSKITEQLNELYKSLGELSKMQTGIESLNRSLSSNVKQRGIWGEAQLRDILRETMTPSQYEENIATKQGSRDPVEFAIKIPSKDGNGTILLPIDCKLPMDTYNSVVEAYDSGDKTQIKAAIAGLTQRIKSEARDIRDKYIDEPRTTNFAIMYLPTESLYAEVLKTEGLAETCRRDYKVVIAGPTTITALLNSLRVGFESLTMSKKTEEIRKLFVNVNKQFGKLDELVDKTQKNLDTASKANGDLKTRTDMIRKKLASFGDDEIEGHEESVLQIESDN